MTYKTETIHKRINPADYTHDTDPIETELLKWFRMMPDDKQRGLVTLAQTIGYNHMISERSKEDTAS